MRTEDNARDLVVDSDRGEKLGDLVLNWENNIRHFIQEIMCSLVSIDQAQAMLKMAPSFK